MLRISSIAPALLVLLATVQARPDPDAVWQPRERRQGCNFMALYPLLSEMDTECSTAFTSAAFGAPLPPPGDLCICLLQVPNTAANRALTNCEVSNIHLLTFTDACRAGGPQTPPPTPPPTPSPTPSPNSSPVPPAPPPPTNRECTLVQLASGAAQLNSTCRAAALGALRPSPPPVPSHEEFCQCFSQPTRAYMAANLDCTAPAVAPDNADRTLLSAWDLCASDFPVINYCNRMEDSCPLFLGRADTCTLRGAQTSQQRRTCLAAAMCDPAAHAACTGGSATQCSALAACASVDPTVTGVTDACLAAVGLTGVTESISVCQATEGFEASEVPPACQAAVITALQTGCTPPPTPPPTTPAPIGEISASADTTEFSVIVRFAGDLAAFSAADQEQIKTQVGEKVHSRATALSSSGPLGYTSDQIVVTLSSGSIVATATFPAGSITEAEATEVANGIERRPITFVTADGGSVPSVGATSKQTGGGATAAGGDGDDSTVIIIVGAAVGGLVVIGALIFLATRSGGGGGGGGGGGSGEGSAFDNPMYDAGGQKMTKPADNFGF